MRWPPTGSCAAQQPMEKVRLQKTQHLRKKHARDINLQKKRMLQRHSTYRKKHDDRRQAAARTPRRKTRACMHAYMDVCVRECVCVSACMCAHVCTCVCSQAHEHRLRVVRPSSQCMPCAFFVFVWLSGPSTSSHGQCKLYPNVMKW